MSRCVPKCHVWKVPKSASFLTFQTRNAVNTLRRSPRMAVKNEDSWILSTWTATWWLQVTGKSFPPNLGMVHWIHSDPCLWKLLNQYILKVWEKILVGGFNLFEKYLSNWESSRNRGKNKKYSRYLKPPPRIWWYVLKEMENDWWTSANKYPQLDIQFLERHPCVFVQTMLWPAFLMPSESVTF